MTSEVLQAHAKEKPGMDISSPVNATHMPTDFQLPVSVFLGAFPKYVRLEIQMNYHPLGTVFHQLQMGVGI